MRPQQPPLPRCAPDHWFGRTLLRILAATSKRYGKKRCTPEQSEKQMR